MFKKINNLDNSKFTVLIGPVVILMILSMMILPLSPLILDFFLTFNILSSIIILLISIFNKNKLELTIFPTILLLSTLMRLSLNIASTRVILMYGHNGQSSAGQVISAFGNFLVGNNTIIGIVIFIILIIINFIVITKGSSRIAEVVARFTLDSMPGKQIAIDADLNAGIIGEKDAKIRRLEVNQEANFYGSMDGASKFIRGDAVASLLIIFINLIGGLLVGVFQYNMSIYEAGKNYTILTIGDGLVSQIPALMISTATGITITRVNNAQNINEQLVSQILSNPKIILISSLIIGLLGIIPGTPKFIFLFFSIFLVLIILIKYKNYKIFNNFDNKTNNYKKNNVLKDKYEANLEDIIIEDALRIEIGYQLISMVDNRKHSELLNRIIGIRKKFANDIGYLPPTVHVQDNLDIPSTQYRIMMNGVEIGKGNVYPNHILAIQPVNKKRIDLPGEICKDPVFGLNSIWISKDLQEQAKLQDCTLIDASTIITTHLNQTILKHSSELFGYQEVKQLIEYLKYKHPNLIENVIPDIISITTFHKILKNLLLEGIPIKDTRSIIECLIENSQFQNDIELLTNLVRHKISGFITQYLFDNNEEIYVIGIHVNLEQILMKIVQNNSSIVEPNIVNRILKQVKKALDYMNKNNLPKVLLVAPQLRFIMVRILRPIITEISVLSSSEIYGLKKINFSFMIE